MKKYIDSLLIGVGIASFCTIIQASHYFGNQTIIISLAQGGLQGLLVPLIYHQRNHRIPYLIKFSSHAFLSYLVALSIFSLSSLNISFWSFTAYWFLIFSITFSFFYLRNHLQTNKTNSRLKKLKENTNENH